MLTCENAREQQNAHGVGLRDQNQLHDSTTDGKNNWLLATLFFHESGNPHLKKTRLTTLYFSLLFKN